MGGTVADLFEASTRGPAMSLFSLCAFAGTGLGPATMGWVELNPHLGWRWIGGWILVIIIAVIALAIIFLTRETRGAFTARLSNPDTEHPCVY